MTRKKPKGIRHLPQRRGRKPKEGMLRFPGGKIKNPTPKPDDGEPNAVVMKVRRALAGSDDPKAIAAAENPLDLCRLNGWLTADQHDLATWY